MAQLPIQSGVRVRDGSFRTSYPVNLRHKIVDSGVSKGELITTEGVRQMGTGPGSDRGGTVWNDIQYRVMGDKLVSIATDGTVASLATLPDDGLPCQFAASFDRLAIAGAGRLSYYDGETLTEVTDTDLGAVLDLAWLAGYFVTTDGTSIVVTELNDPTSVDPLKYGSAESDPDPVTGLQVLNEELVGFGRYTIQFFRNVGGAGFPFQTIIGATIPFGCIGPNAKCRVADTIAFVGGGRGEPLGVFVLSGGTAVRVSDEEIEAHIRECGSPETITVEARKLGFEQQVVVHLDNCSVALTLNSSQEAGAVLWHILQGREGGYRARNAVWFNQQHWVADGLKVGVLDSGLTAQFGTEPGWSFDAGLLYNEGQAVIIHEVEITGQFSAEAVFFSMSHDGETWSREISRRLTGQRNERVVWRPGVKVAKLCGLHFRGFGNAGIARADARGEALAA